MKRSFLATAVACLLATGVAWAAPDFSGTWILNTDKGENLGMVAAIQETLTVNQTPAELHVHHVAVFQGKPSERDVNYGLSGEPVENFAAMGERSMTRSRWDGDQLVTTWTSEGAIAGTEVVKTETRSLSADGNSMTVATARADRPAMVLVYDRAPQ